MPARCGHCSGKATAIWVSPSLWHFLFLHSSGNQLFPPFPTQSRFLWRETELILGGRFHHVSNWWVSVRMTAGIVEPDTQCIRSRGTHLLSVWEGCEALLQVVRLTRSEAGKASVSLSSPAVGPNLGGDPSGRQTSQQRRKGLAGPCMRPGGSGATSREDSAHMGGS